MESWVEKVELLANEICRNQGCVLYDLDFSGAGKGRTLRLFIDKEGGASIDDCSNVSKGINEVLDEKDIVPGGNYHLEVSTPGIDRVLKKKWHFEKVIGKKISVKSKAPFQQYGMLEKKWMNAKTIEAELTSVEENCIHFKVKEGDIKIPLSEIDKAKVVFVFAKHK